MEMSRDAAGTQEHPCYLQSDGVACAPLIRNFAPSYFDDIFVHSRASTGTTDLTVHLGHLRQVFEAMRENKLYANLKKCIFCAPEIPVLGSYVCAKGVRADP